MSTFERAIDCCYGGAQMLRGLHWLFNTLLVADTAKRIEILQMHEFRALETSL